MNNYALTLVLKPDVEEKARKELLESMAKKMGKKEKEEEWGVRDLAYPIKHQRKGYFLHYQFCVEPKDIAPLDKALKLDEDILRYLLVRV
ncbi:MAG: 30S ribosomal protein S6 [Candidatus Daviesbacteria bacterium GW2011_GWA1_41_61]|uniref:Small ribosomal subunit protein bS6 n=1 Tax=Candidatus Daviesbacteria bacterium GW2011_GWA2_40_9 TaxID=1618424 RepID=A0A0G0X6F5_9BACT|nr:MAG: 30S ribosomal protein S6, small subunit ribosomal protein S6 [Candidatus Daviesbacteria bacterium GW2011_GWC1_40_9]KKR83207.1 MAG: 30S ribosomal protein S6 [Candidatus Daviesbacteria bacterium GW2011_GWA2_40_9]KKR93553.1 MAG: 30S ribosomal protein S6 [Candidatus Daviesbacteria bacterium GW2011_GWB1_41_15]KKS14896.1 MAG: 30S ribosomal protein S6 [Candidatus Daviesbacteria bacterium GW2011_GWA1_41_61]